MDKLGKEVMIDLSPLGDSLGFRLKSPFQQRSSNIDIKYIREYNQMTQYPKGFYINRHYETGAIARGMIS